MKKAQIRVLKGVSCALAVSLALCGCASNKSSSSSSGNKPGSMIGGVTIEPSKHLPLPDTSSTIVTEAQPMYASTTALEYSKQMGNGINLGNTFEACGTLDTLGPRQSTQKYETFWGQPVTTQKMIQGYKAAGFDTIRIPISWLHAMDFVHGDYVLDTAFLDRIETVVKWAIDEDMTVIINEHWDHGWWGMFGSARAEIRDSARDLYRDLWTQIGTRFKNYSYKLIFEGGNEEHGPRFNDTDGVADSGTLSEDECYEVANEVNQLFVDVIRGLGGNNAQRFLLIPGINTNIDKTCDSRFKMPKDSANQKLFVSVHYYDPSPFCLGTADLWGTQKDIGEQNSALEKMLKFTNAGYGVIIGEYGALPHDGEFKTSTIVWTENVLDNCDLNNYVPVLWDQNGFYNKETAKLRTDELITLFKEYSYDNQKNTPYEDIQDAAEDRLAERQASAPKILSDNPLVGRTDVGIGYIMFGDKNWAVNYSMGDDYNPDSKSKGMKTKDAEITGPGTYTVSLDFTGMKKDGTGSAYSFAFSALGIDNGEKLFPGYVVTIKDIQVNGKSVPFKDNYFTTSDDGDCTRVNIFNEWVKDADVPKVKTGRAADGTLQGKTACIIDRDSSVFTKMNTLSITFDYGPAN